MNGRQPLIFHGVTSVANNQQCLDCRPGVFVKLPCFY
jgi:hypothetical protein